jgi:hypothetical protein
MAATAACVLINEGVRDTTYTIRFNDASGRLVRERLGTAAEGWTKRKARAVLNARVVAVQKDRYTKPQPVSFASFTDGWVDRHCDTRALKRSTRASYHTIVERHLVRAFGRLTLEQVTPTVIEEYLDTRRQHGVAAATLHRQLATLSLIFRTAVKGGLVRDNPGAACRPSEGSTAAVADPHADRDRCDGACVRCVDRGGCSRAGSRGLLVGEIVVSYVHGDGDPTW